MKYTTKPYPAKKAPKDKWYLEVSFMSGDGDAYETEVYTIKNLEKFAEMHQFFEKVLAFRGINHNLFIDMWVIGKSKQAILAKLDPEKTRTQYTSWGRSHTDVEACVEACKKTIEAVTEFYGTYDSVDDMVTYLHIDIPNDVTCEGHNATPVEIVDMYHYDQDGCKHKIEYTA
jgi:hypothetical protein